MKIIVGDNKAAYTVFIKNSLPINIKPNTKQIASAAYKKYADLYQDTLDHNGFRTISKPVTPPATIPDWEKKK